MKYYIQKLIILFLITLSFNSTLFAGDFQVEYQPHVIEKVMQFEQKGVLKQKNNGFVYVSVSQDFITETVPYIDSPVTIQPNKGAIGAHISVIYETELDEDVISNIREIGTEFDFNILEFRTVKVRQNNQTKKLWILAVESPDLEMLRQSYGLSPKLQNHDYHITIGTQSSEKHIFEFIIEEIEELEEAA